MKMEAPFSARPGESSATVRDDGAGSADRQVLQEVIEMIPGLSTAQRGEAPGPGESLGLLDVVAEMVCKLGSSSEHLSEIEQLVKEFLQLLSEQREAVLEVATQESL